MPLPRAQVSDSDEFIVNDAFSSQKFHVAINAVQHMESALERKTTDEFVARERQFQIDAAVVRIMKNRRTLTQADLFAQVRVLVLLVRVPVVCWRTFERVLLMLTPAVSLLRCSARLLPFPPPTTEFGSPDNSS